MELKAVHPGKGQHDGMGASGPSGARPWSPAPAPPDAQLQKLPERKGNPPHQMLEQLNALFPPFLKLPTFHFFPGSLAAPLPSGEGVTHPGSHLSTGPSPGCSLALTCILSASAGPVGPLLTVPEPLQPPCVRVQCWSWGALWPLLGWAPGSLGSQPSACL